MKRQVETALLAEALQEPDQFAQPGPEELAEQERAEASNEVESLLMSERMEGVYWPTNDENSPCYAYLHSEAASSTFNLKPEHLEKLISLNSFELDESNLVALAFRGCSLVGTDEVEDQSIVQLQNTRPDHRNFRCTMGFYNRERQHFTLFTGSTVPCRRAVWGYANGGDASNLLPTGMYRYFIWRHKKITPALRLSAGGESKEQLEKGGYATVLRTKNDYAYGLQDKWDRSRPLDNVHCSYFTEYRKYYGAYFSSWGCLTVRGKDDPTDQWKKFQEILSSVGIRNPVNLVLLTGKDLAIVCEKFDDSQYLGDNLRVLRTGSNGEQVQRLQQRLGIEDDGMFGSQTRKTLSDFQRTLNNNSERADGLYSVRLDRQLDWGIFGAGS